MISRNFKAMSYGLEESAKDIENISSVGINVKKNVVDQNVDTLKDLASKEAEINKEAIKTTMSAIREGLQGEESMYCKHCGAQIDTDSKFCKKCGKEQ